MVGILTAPLVASTISRGSFETFSWSDLVMAWVAWVVFLNGGTLVATFSLILMVTGAAIAFLVTPAFGLVTAGFVIMSVLYSHDAFRWKSIPGRDLAINIVGYGGATTPSGILAGQAARGGPSTTPAPRGRGAVCG